MPPPADAVSGADTQAGTGPSRRPSARPGTGEIRTPLHQSIFDALKLALVVGEFRPGEKLPLRALAERQGTSLIPVRDALQRLEGLGALEAQAGRAMRVPRLTGEEIAEIRELRLAVEGLVIRRLCRLRANDPAPGALPAPLLGAQAALTRLSEACAAEDLRGFLLWNWRFHMALARAAGSGTIVAALDPLWPRMGPSIACDNPAPGDVAAAAAVHWRLWEAIVAGQQEAALAALEDDVLNRTMT